VLSLIPPHLVGKYNRVGWVANGIEPYGLAQDPLGADGNLFYRGWFNLVMAAYEYVSGDDKWRKPFKIVGYQDREFEWTQDRIVERLNKQWGERPSGIHCENTKIWPYCLSAAGLGLHLYDRLHATKTHSVVESWFEFFRHNYMGVTADGKLEWSTVYYDPIVNYKLNYPTQDLGTVFYMLPQHPELASFLYNAVAAANDWHNPNTPVRELSYVSAVVSREMADETAYKKLSAAAEDQFEPKFFGQDAANFGWWFNLDGKFPRGQQSALMMVSQVGKPGEWSRAFTNPHRAKFNAPTVEGVDFPAMGIHQAWNDPATGTLNLATYAATPSRKGAAGAQILAKVVREADHRSGPASAVGGHPGGNKSLAVAIDCQVCTSGWTLDGGRDIPRFSERNMLRMARSSRRQHHGYTPMSDISCPTVCQDGVTTLPSSIPRTASSLRLIR
jgi:Linalool dehydratase/isomerase